MSKGPVPSIVPFSLGSLGFMTPFYSEHYPEYPNSILRGPISITLRHRLQCYIIRGEANSDYENEGPMLVLNEVTIDRGISSFLTNLECYCNNSFVTCVQGDDLILSTTSGSTPYSLAAGGSMVHPHGDDLILSMTSGSTPYSLAAGGSMVRPHGPRNLFAPFCGDSLSFPPLILPEHVTLRVALPSTAGAMHGLHLMARFANSWSREMHSFAAWHLGPFPPHVSSIQLVILFPVHGRAQLHLRKTRFL